MENNLYRYWPIVRRPRLELPNGARVAFWVGLNIEHFLLDKPSTSITPVTASLVPDPLNYGWRDYGPRVGVWRVMDVLDRVGMRASVLLNSDVCQYYPEIVEEGNQRKWAWLAHGKNNSTLQSNMSPEEERSYLADVVGTIKQSTGQQPRGWLGPALSETFETPNILAELGVNYTCDWCNDDQPYPMQVRQGRMISLPYSIEVNDIPVALDRGLPAEQFTQMIKDQFDQLYADAERGGRIMAVALHPFIIGQPFRAKYLEQALSYVAGHDKVWIATSDEIADWYYANYYEQALSQIEAARAKYQ
jgi:allantoinase